MSATRLAWMGAAARVVHRCALAFAMAGWLQPVRAADDAALSYERETRILLRGQATPRESTTVVRVWVQGELARVETAAVPGVPAIVLLRRADRVYSLDLEHKVATAIPAAGSLPALGPGRHSDLRDHRRLLLQRGLSAAGDDTVDGQAAELFVLPPAAGANLRKPSVHKVWFSKRSGLPLMETVEQPDSTVTVWYRNVTSRRSVAPTLFEVPGDFKVIEVQ